MAGDTVIQATTPTATRQMNDMIVATLREWARKDRLLERDETKLCTGLTEEVSAMNNALNKHKCKDIRGVMDEVHRLHRLLCDHVSLDGDTVIMHARRYVATIRDTLPDFIKVRESETKMLLVFEERIAAIEVAREAMEHAGITNIPKETTSDSVKPAVCLSFAGLISGLRTLNEPLGFCEFMSPEEIDAITTTQCSSIFSLSSSQPTLSDPEAIATLVIYLKTELPISACVEQAKLITKKVRVLDNAGHATWDRAWGTKLSNAVRQLKLKRDTAQRVAGASAVQDPNITEIERKKMEETAKKEIENKKREKRDAEKREKKKKQETEKREKERLEAEEKRKALDAAVFSHKESAIMKQATSEYPSELVEHIAVLYFLREASFLRQQRGLSLNELTAQDFVLAISKVHPKPATGSDLALPTSLADVEEYFEKHTGVTPPANKYERYARLSSLKADREKSVPLPSIHAKRPGSGILSPMAKKNKPDDTNGP